MIATVMMRIGTRTCEHSYMCETFEKLVNHVKLENPVIVSVILWQFTIVPKESSKRAVWWKFLFNS